MSQDVQEKENSVLDQAGNVREGEELDLKSIDGLEGAPKVKQYPGGASNLTYEIQYGDRSFILRRPPFGKIAKSAHDMLREASIMAALKPVYPYVPEILATCDDHTVLGCDFYVMEKLVGVIPRQNMPKQMTLTPDQTRALCLSVIDRFMELHQVAIKGTELETLGKGEGYVERQILGWSDRYVKAKTDDATDFEGVMSWLKSNMPNDVDQVLIHNDFRFDNVVLDPNNSNDVIGVLDWEMEIGRAHV